ncbi:DNA polymerase III subunit beta [Nocardiopsis sp. FR26]|uniref:DNA polymerase III subunit beta n=1 Tax=Nocardiopsis sp. FR26 TaxID=2605987 RepID=UPI001359DF5E|nr:DNA polymerase III subunit beta [Nocardiopsis sp. FR26]
MTLTHEDARLLTGLEVATTRATLTNALTTVAVAIHTRPAVPILAGVHLTGDADGTLTLTGFDYDTAVTVTLPGVATNPGRVVLSHAELAGLLAATAKGTPAKKAGAAPVVLAQNGNKPTLTVDGYTLPVADYPVDEYPTLPTAPAPTLTVDAATFAAEVARVVPAAGGADDIPQLVNVQLETYTRGALCLTATDRYRIAQATIPGTRAPRAPRADLGQVVRVNAALVGKVTKHLKGDTVTVGVHGDMVMLASGPVTVVTRTSEDEFPAVEKAIPTTIPMSVTVDHKAVAAAITKAGNILAAKGERGLSVGITVNPGSVAVAPDLPGVLAPQITADTSDADGEVSVYFNPKFLAAAVGAFKSEDTVTFHLDTPTRPVVVTGGGHTVKSAPYRHLVQPIRVH